MKLAVRLAFIAACIAVVIASGILIGATLQPAPNTDYLDSIPPCSAYASTADPVLAPNSVTDTCWYSEGDRVLLSNS